ncbi:MAG TPA: hypothetical protein PKZ96_04370 [Bacteroides xylanisolvens]|nr:hypothetical protein [Bacteroides xylanisolvens]
MRRIFAIWAVCLCWGILNAAPLGPFNATLLEQLKNDYQKGEREIYKDDSSIGDCQEKTSPQ